MEVEMKIRGLMVDPVTNMPIVVLKDVNGMAILPIWVGVYEANAIALEIEKVATPRPMTHDLIRNLLFGLETGVKKVVDAFAGKRRSAANFAASGGAARHPRPAPCRWRSAPRSS